MLDELSKEINIAVSRARNDWFEAVGSDADEDIAQEVWYEYLTSPSTRRVASESCRSDRIGMFKRMAHRHFSSMHTKNEISEDKSVASVDMVKATLRGNPPAPMYVHLVETAMLELSLHDNGYYEALRNRYVEGVTPEQGNPAMLDTRAHVALTDEVNTVFRHLNSPPKDYYWGSDTPFPTLQDGPKLGNAVEACTRKATGGHSDPTGESAVALAINPYGQELFYEDTPLLAILAGEKLQPAEPVQGKPYKVRKYWKGVDE